MHEHLFFLLLSLLVLSYGLFSKRLLQWNISGPMIFTATGFTLWMTVLRDHVLSFQSEAVQTIAEITLILVLFSDAAVLDLRQLKANWRLPARLLFVALPLTVIFSTLVAHYVYPSQPLLYALLLALILAPTDAALGKIVVTDPRLPQTVRNTINVESGLNDGIVFPVLLTVLAMIGSDASQAREGWVGYIAQQIALGALSGAFLGYAGARIMRKALDHRWMERRYANLAPVALAVFAFYFAEFIGGNGYIAAFFSGLFLGNADNVLKEHVEGFAESEGEILVMISFLVFGLAFIPATLPYWDGKALAYALLSLTLLRMVPVVLSFGLSRVDVFTRLFYGWFGPRGIASILYILVAVHQLGSIEGHERIFAVASLTVVLSILLHGLSAQPLALLYARYITQNPSEDKKV